METYLQFYIEWATISFLVHIYLFILLAEGDISILTDLYRTPAQVYKDTLKYFSMSKLRKGWLVLCVTLLLITIFALCLLLTGPFIIFVYIIKICIDISSLQLLKITYNYLKSKLLVIFYKEKQ